MQTLLDQDRDGNNVPYILRAADACVALCEQVASVARAHPGAVNKLQNLALTVATVERQLCTFLQDILDQVADPLATANPNEEMNLTATAARLHRILPKLQSSRYAPIPTGGLASLLYHLMNTCDDVTRTLLQAYQNVPSWGQRLKKAGASAIALATLSAYLYSASPLPIKKLVRGKYRRFFTGAAGSIFLAIVLEQLSNHRRKKQHLSKLEKYERQLSILLRLWVLVMSVVKDAKIKRNVSYNILVYENRHVGAPPIHDFTGNKIHAREVIESVTLPSAAAFWYERDPGLKLIKSLMNSVYSASAVANRLFPSEWQWSVFGQPFMLVSLVAFFTVFQQKASEIAHRELVHADPVHLYRAWNIVNYPLLNYPLQILAYLKGLKVQKRIKVRGVPVYLLSARSLPRRASRSSPSSRSLPEADVIFYCHGGGFFSCLYPTDLEVLTRWAAQTGAVIVYTDYVLATQKKFPGAVNELHEVYRATIAGELGFKPRRLALAGESAGGTLATSLQLKIIQAGDKSPDGLVLIYPALNINSSTSPSRTVHLHDPILPLGLVLSALKVYTGGEIISPPDLYFLSPALAPDTMLAKFPHTSIVVGGLDPLLDDAVDFDVRLRRLRIPGTIRVIQNLPHGFVGFRNILRDADKACELALDWLQKILNIQDSSGSNTT